MHGHADAYLGSAAGPIPSRGVLFSSVQRGESAAERCPGHGDLLEFDNVPSCRSSRLPMNVKSLNLFDPLEDLRRCPPIFPFTFFRVKRETWIPV